MEKGRQRIETGGSFNQKKDLKKIVLSNLTVQEQIDIFFLQLTLL